MISPSEFTAQCKVVLLGSSNAGKTSVLRRLIYDKFSEEVSPTLGSSLSTFEAKVDDVNVKLNIWDTAGQENYRSLAKVYYRDANVAIILFDVTSQESFSDVDFWRKFKSTLFVRYQTEITLLEKYITFKTEYLRSSGE